MFLTSLISSTMGLSSVRLCLDEMLNTSTKAWPVLIVSVLAGSMTSWPLPTSDHGEPPHGGELVAARGVRDLQDHVPVTALDHLPASSSSSLT